MVKEGYEHSSHSSRELVNTGYIPLVCTEYHKFYGKGLDSKAAIGDDYTVLDYT